MQPANAPYPPEPWHLRATFHLSLWWMKPSELPPLPAGVRPVSIFGRALLGAAWVAYRPGGVLTYNEVAALVVVRQRLTLAVTTTDIWVDSAASAAGGRELWGVPKELARFDVVEDPAVFRASARAEADGAPIASLRFVPGKHVPLPSLPLATAQEWRGTLKLTRLALRGRARAGGAEWRFAPEGRLAYMPSRPPALSLRWDEADLSFGI